MITINTRKWESRIPKSDYVTYAPYDYMYFMWLVDYR